MFNILIPVGCRSDEGLSAPVIRRLKNNNKFCVKTIQLVPQDFKASYEIAEYHCKAVPHVGNSQPFKPDMILITGDRVEMCAAAAAAFHNKVKIAHLYAGVVNDPVTTFDDVDRHCITLWSDIQLCESMDTSMRVWDLFDSIDKEPNDYRIGITHLDDMEIDESLVPGEPYDLIMVNWEPLSKEINWLWDDRTVTEIHIGSNPDAYFGDIFGASIYFENLPRAQFLGLLKNCRRFITNSSSAIYEAPYFLNPDQIIMVGDRNRNRGKVVCEPGGSDRVVSALEEYSKNLRK